MLDGDSGIDLDYDSNNVGNIVSIEGYGVGSGDSDAIVGVLTSKRHIKTTGITNVIVFNRTGATIPAGTNIVGCNLYRDTLNRSYCQLQSVNPDLPVEVNALTVLVGVANGVVSTSVANGATFEIDMLITIDRTQSALLEKIEDKLDKTNGISTGLTTSETAQESFNDTFGTGGDALRGVPNAGAVELAITDSDTSTISSTSYAEPTSLGLESTLSRVTKNISLNLAFKVTTLVPSITPFLTIDDTDFRPSDRYVFMSVMNLDTGVWYLVRVQDNGEIEPHGNVLPVGNYCGGTAYNN